MPDIMNFFNEQESLKDPNPVLMIHESDGSYSWSGETSGKGTSEWYFYNLRYLKRGATYRMSYTARTTRTDSQRTTSIQVYNGTTEYIAGEYVSSNQWKDYSYTFLVADEFNIYLTLGWDYETRAYFKNIRLECVDQDDFEKEITSSTTLDIESDHTLYAKWSQYTWDDYAAESYESGSGTAASPYIIKTPAQMAKFAKDSKSNATSSYFKLEADIDLSGHIWNSVNIFGGTFDGNMHTISNVMGYGESCRGLFNQGSCIIRNLILSNSTFRTVVNTENTGAIIGNTNNSLIENCIVDNVRLESTNGRNITFLVGSNGGTIRNCLVRNCYGVDIKGEGRLYVFAGYQNGNGKVENCAVVNCQMTFTNADGSNNIAHTSEGGSITSTYVDCTMVVGGNVKFIKNIYGTSSDFSGFFYNANINGGYPIPKTLVSLGSVDIPSATIYNALISKGFKTT